MSKLNDEKDDDDDSIIASNKAISADGSTTLPLEWTQMGVKADEAMPLRYPHDVAEIDPTDADLCIVGTAGQKITQIPPDFWQQCHPKLSTFVLRSHLITKLQGIQGFTDLEVLELYDNQVQALECLEGPGPKLRVLDMSYNSIRDMSPVSICSNLQELYLANNKLKRIAGLEGLTQLRKIDLGANRIRVIEGLDELENLEELWIGKNKIERIQGLENLKKLRRLDVQSNRLTSIENLRTQNETLEELYLAHNGINDDGAMYLLTSLSVESEKKETEPAPFPNLNVLDLSRNRLTSTKAFGKLAGLEELWISGNQITTFDDILPLKEAAEAGIQSLDTVYLEYNPIADEFEYRKRLKEWVPSLSQIDATMIGGFGSTMQSGGIVGAGGLRAGAQPSAAMAAALSTGPRPSAAMAAASMTPIQLQQAALDRAKREAEQSS